MRIPASLSSCIPLNNSYYQKLKRADCMDEKSAWECGILSRDNMSHPSIQGDQHQCDTKRKQFLTKEALLDNIEPLY
jgi:hypothetical protein